MRCSTSERTPCLHLQSIGTSQPSYRHPWTRPGVAYRDRSPVVRLHHKQNQNQVALPQDTGTVPGRGSFQMNLFHRIAALPHPLVISQLLSWAEVAVRSGLRPFRTPSLAGRPAASACARSPDGVALRLPVECRCWRSVEARKVAVVVCLPWNKYQSKVARQDSSLPPLGYSKTKAALQNQLTTTTMTMTTTHCITTNRNNVKRTS